MHPADRAPIFEHTPLLTLDEAAETAARRRAPLHAWCVIDREPVDVFFHAEMVIHVDALGLATVDAIATLLRQPLRLYQIELYRWPHQRTLACEWTKLRAVATTVAEGGRAQDLRAATARLGTFGAQM